MRYRPFRRAAVAVLLALTLAACGGEPPAAPAEGEAVPVRLATARADAQPQTFRFAGTVRGTRRVPLSTKLMGTIAKLDLDEGDRVAAGQVVARIRSDDVEAQRAQVMARLREARAALENARTTFERIQALHAKGSATEQELDDARTGYERAQAQVDALESRRTEVQETLDYATVTAPLGGVVVAKHAEAGALAAPGQPLVTLETIDALKIVANVPEQRVNRFAVGDPVAVVVRALGPEARPGTVTHINPSGQRGSRQFGVHVRLDDDAPTLKPGMYAEVRLTKGTADALTIPTDALVRRGQLTGLYAVTDSSRALLRWVRTGAETAGRVEILSGLAPGERYVAAPDARLRDGARVRDAAGTAADAGR